MDNPSQNIEMNSEEAEITSPIPEEPKNDDIQFEEVIDIDDIQRKLEEKLARGDLDDEEEPEESDMQVPTFTEEPTEVTPVKAVNLPQKPNNAKKYVIYVDPENIDYIENLALNERREIINKILREQNQFSIEQRELEKKKSFLKHALLASATFIIFFPLMFIGVNRALESTIVNYQQARTNFAKLYREQGKIKMQLR